jgi:hypothetical protein
MDPLPLDACQTLHLDGYRVRLQVRTRDGRTRARIQCRISLGGDWIGSRTLWKAAAPEADRSRLLSRGRRLLAAFAELARLRTTAADAEMAELRAGLARLLAMPDCRAAGIDHVRTFRHGKAVSLLWSEQHGPRRWLATEDRHTVEL